MPSETHDHRGKSGHRTGPVLAAGAVLWRPGADGAPEVAVVHRPRYDDWSLPKGKVDKGESEPATAVREIFEETGFRSRLGRRLGTARYLLNGSGEKKVTYWAARADDGDFLANREVDRLEWLPVAAAADRLGYPQDRKVLRRFARLPHDTHTLLVVRHATAGRKSRYHGDDRCRPLDANGRTQAESMVPLLLAFGAERLHAADRTRCHQTLEPLAEALRVAIENEPALTEEAYADNRKAARHRFLQIAELPGTRAVCSQGKVIPHIIDWWCERDAVSADKSRNRKGSIWVLSLHNGRLIAADHIASPLPVRN